MTAPPRLAIALVLAACSFHHVSGDYTCTKQADCSTGRTCQDGFCVLDVLPPDGSAASHDAATHDSSSCPSGCTSCDVAQHTCTIDCSATSCQNTVTCPAGYHCTIDCNTDGACQNGVRCQQAASCTIACTSDGSCQGVQCGAGPCDVQCTGQNSCQGVACGSSCQCDVTCTGQQTCPDPSSISCTATTCRALPVGCTSAPSQCHSTCP